MNKLIDMCKGNIHILPLVIILLIEMIIGYVEIARWEQGERRKLEEEVIAEIKAMESVYIEPVNPIKEPEPVKTPEPVIVEDKDLEDELFWDSLELLACCVEAEAGNQDIYGKALVVDVVLNRVDDPDFPDTIEEVIYQTNQFEVVSNGTIDTVEPAQSTYDIVLMEAAHRSNNEVLFFNNKGFTIYGTEWEKVGDHYFSTK